MAKRKTEKAVILPRVRTAIVELKIRGTSPLIVHRFSDKARAMIEQKQQGKATSGRQIRDPEEEFRNSLYTFSKNGKECYGFPASGFKKCAVSAVTSLKKSAGLTKVGVQQAFHVLDDGDGLVEIRGKPRRRTDMVRIGRGVADVRYRAEFPKWEATLRILYNEAAITAEQIAGLFSVSGFGTGIGDWRPQKGGSYGMFEVV